MRISLCMIVKDEEQVLGRCLESVKALVDEIVIVDTGSKDNTVAIAKKYTDHVFFEAWQDDFSHSRNISFSKATGDYLMWLDADDIVTQENAERFHALRKTLEENRCDVMMCPYETGGMKFMRERLVRKAADMKWQGHVHECIVPRGKIMHADFAVTHLGSAKERGMRNLHIYQKWAKKEQLTGRDLFYYGRELYYHHLYTEAEAVLREMLAGESWYVNKIEACKTLAACYSETGRTTEALETLFASFRYGEPRASVLCEIGTIFKREKKYREAVWWYKCALEAEDHTAEGDFELPACRDIIPLLELVYLYHVLNEPAKSLDYHKKSEAIAPDHPSVCHNRAFFGE